jgi:phosphate transport system substrate-binding protein
MTSRKLSWVMVVLLVFTGPLLTARGDQSSQLAPLDAADPVRGPLALGGSVALADLVSIWVQGFRQINPLVEPVLGDAGGDAGLDALVNGVADAVLLGNWPTQSELEAFEHKYGYPPQLIPVARDAVAVYVNTSNPVGQVTLAQLDAMYSATRRCGAQEAVTDWKQLNVPGVETANPILTYGLDDSTDVYQLFRQVALCGGDFRRDYQAMVGPEAVEAAIASQPGAIGFSSSALHSAGMRYLAVAPDSHAQAVLPTAEDIRSNRYPMSRTLLIAVNVPPGKSVPPVLQAFVDYVLSPRGQASAAKLGYVAL